MSKGPEAFRTISEVATDLDLPQHVLRFWETRFGQIRPMKRGGGRRYYRPDDVDLLRGIRKLLYGEGYTIKGVQRILREQGPRIVLAIGQGAALTGLAALGEAAPDERDLDAARRGGWAPATEEEAEELLAVEESEIPPEPEPPASSAPSYPRRLIDRVLGEGRSSEHSLGRDDIRRLEAALVELLDCKRLLDQTR